MTQDQSLFWYRETGTPHEVHSFAASSFFFMGRTALQDVVIFDSHEYGKMLVIDGRTQSAQEDEYIYHEALVHPAMLTHADPRQVLIIGGGEGASLREVLRYRSVERVVMVDIDRELVELCQKWLPEWHQGAFQDPRVELVFADGQDYIDQTALTFDVVIIDICDALEEGPALALYTERFYRKVQSRLASDGLLVVQAMELSGLDYVDHVQVRNTLRRVFPLVRSYATFVPSYWTNWGFLVASHGLDPAGVAPGLLLDRLRTRGATGATDLTTRLAFYDADAHVGMFALPKDVKARLDHPLGGANPPRAGAL